MAKKGLIKIGDARVDTREVIGYAPGFLVNGGIVTPAPFVRVQLEGGGWVSISTSDDLSIEQVLAALDENMGCA